MAVRAPHLFEVLQAFCLAAFAELGPEAAQGGELPFDLQRNPSGFTEYRPLVRDHVLARAFWLARLPDAKVALDELRREPAAAIFAVPTPAPSRRKIEPSSGRFCSHS